MTMTSEKDRIAREAQFEDYREMREYVLDHFLTWLETSTGPHTRDEAKIEMISSAIMQDADHYYTSSWSSVYYA